VFWTRTDDTANGSLDTVLYRHFGADGTLLSDPIELAHTPSDLSVSSDFSEIAEIRAALNGNSLLGIAEIVGDEINSNPESFTVDTQFTLPPPQISNPDTVVAAAGTGAVDLRIAAPTESDGTTPTVTIDTVPSYGTVQYFDGAQFVDVTANMSLTPAQLATLRYVPPASGEHGGESLTYTASDGTAAVHGTVDISVVVDSTVAAKLFFSAFGGPGNGGPPDLFTLDSSGQPVALALNAANGSFAGTDGGFFQFAGNLYFMASTPASGNAVVLQKMTPNGTVTAVGDGSGGFFGDPGDDVHFTEFAGSLYLRAIGPDGDQLVRIAANGVAHSIVLNPGFEAFAGANGGFTELDGSLYFSAVTPASSFGNPDLIRLDADGTITDISAVNSDFSSAGEDGGFVAFNHALYFNAFSFASSFGDTLIRLDAGSTEPVPVDASDQQLGHLFTGVSSGFHVFDGNLYFNETTFSALDALVKMDASGNLTEIDYNGDALFGAGAMNGWADMGGSAYFVATTAATGADLFKLDADGTVTAIDVNPGSGDAFDANLLSGFTLFDGSLYFDAYDGNGTGDGLFKLDRDGTLTEIDLGNSPGATTLASVNGGFKQFGGSLYFSAFAQSNGEELIKLDADGTVHVIDVNPGADNAFDPQTPATNNDFAVFPLTVLTGTSGRDILVGGVGGEALDGGAGDDVLEGRNGKDLLTGGDGADVFKFSAIGAANIDTVTDYTLAAGDTLDLADLLDATFPSGGTASDFVRLIASGKDLLLQVDPTGNRSHHWKDVAILQGANTAANDQALTSFGGANHLITESPANTAPVAANDTGAVVEYRTVGGNVIAGASGGGGQDYDPESDPLTVTAITGAHGAGTIGAPLLGAHGTLTLQANGAYRYVADHAEPLAVATVVFDSFTYTLSDGKGGTDTATLTVDIFGASTGTPAPDHLIGSPENDTLDGLGSADLMEGKGGDDLYYVDNAGDKVIEAANAGTDRVLASVSYVLGIGQSIEALTPTDYNSTTNINLTGNALLQTIIGNAGNNVLNDGGAGGGDTMQGLGGDDAYVVNNATDRIIEGAGQGNDQVLASISFVLPIGQSIETLTPTSFTGTTAIDLTGNTLSQRIFGNAGDNVLNDGGAGGADTLAGLGGDDLYYVYNSSDIVIESAGAGTDRVLTNVSFTLGGGQSIESLTPVDYSSTNAINLTGNTLSQSIVGNAGNNVISDGGIGGADTLVGLGGNDTYLVNNASDVVVENTNEGTDRVLASVSYTLGAGQSIESLTPNDYGGTAALHLTGNALSQTIVGNAGDNVLDDGGAGAPDTLQGLGGDDTYIINNSNDIVTEATGGGNDHVLTSVSFTLGAGQEIETLTPMNFGTSTTPINLTGNALSQTIIGNAGANVLNDGGAGQGDTMQGLGGDDTYIVNNASDIVTEGINGGNDHVLTSVSFTLGAGSEIESLTPTSFASTTGLTLTGNAFAQSITGNAGANVINGGAGNDTLQGLGGNDTFYFNSALNASTNVDSILDFTHGTDKIELDHAIFTALSPANPLPAADFTTGAPTTPDQHIIYNAATGALSYDDDGSGAHAAVQLATLTTHPALTSTDIFVV
jgi:ELWxxDGT repeat protein/VCBS repeat-containing protein